MFENNGEYLHWGADPEEIPNLGRGHGCGNNPREYKKKWLRFMLIKHKSSPFWTFICNKM